MRSHFLKAASNRGIVYVGGATASSTQDGNLTPTFSVALNSLTGGAGTAPQSGDFILVVNGVAALSNQNVGVSTAGYTEIVDDFGIDTYYANLGVSYKISNGTETSVSVYNANENAGEYAAVGIVHVWRGVDTSTPLDVTRTTATAGNTGRPDVPSITPVTTGAVILGIGVGTLGVLNNALTASGLSNVVAATQSSGVSGVAGIIAAYTEWTSGAYDMAQFGGGSTGTTNSWAAAAVALRPA